MDKEIKELTSVLKEYKQLDISEQIDYQKFYLYSIITHSTAIEGSTVTEIENQLLFDEGIAAKGSFDAHNILVTIHPWVDGNGRMSRLIANYLQFEFRHIPTKVVKEDKAAYIEALNRSREDETTIPFQEFMLQEHTKNLRNEIAEYKKSINEDLKVVQKKKRWSRNKEGHLATYFRRCQYYVKRNGKQTEHQ